MTTALAPVAPLRPTNPVVGRAAELLAEAQHQIEATIEAMWPDGSTTVGARIPTTSCVVHQLLDPVGAVVGYAKYSFGTPLAVVCDSHLPPPRAVGAGAMECQARQLRRLRSAGIAVCGPAYYRDGVQVTSRIPGRTLAERLVADPAAANGLLSATWQAVAEVHRPYRVENEACREAATTHATITGNFARIRGHAADTNDASLGRGWFGPVDRPLVHAQLAGLIDAVGALASGGEDLPTSTESGMAFGALQPDHVVFSRSGRAVLCSPQLQVASSASDAATLVSRVVLLLAAATPPGADQIAVALVELLDTIAHGPVGVAAEEWLRRVVVLWLMDTICFTGSYLALPRGRVGLPERYAAVGRWVPKALAVAELIARQLRRTGALNATHQGLPAAVGAVAP